MFSRHRTNLEPICLRDKACPVGSVMSRSSSCVLPAAYGYAREIAFTLHHPCDQCASDEGVELAGQLMMSLAGLLRIPLEEISVGVLIMNAQLRAAYPLEHFVLHREGEHPLISTSRSTPSTSRWDFFMAVRVHTSRLLETDSGLAVLLSSDPATLGRVMNFGQLHTFEVAQQLKADVHSVRGLIPVFKIKGLAWGEQPPSSSSSPSSGPAPAPRPSGGDGSPSGGSNPSYSTSSMPPHCSPGCLLDMVGDRSCQPACNVGSCGWDNGDCEYITGSTSRLPPTTTTSTITTAAVAPTPEPGCGCNDVWLGDGICDSYCNTKACWFDHGDCQPTTTTRPSTHTTTTGAAQGQLPASSSSSNNYVTYGNIVITSSSGPPMSTSMLRGTTGFDHTRTGPTTSEKNQTHIISISYDGIRDSGHFIASEQPGGTPSWYIDEQTHDQSAGQSIPLELLCGIALFCMILFVIVGYWSWKWRQRFSNVDEPKLKMGSTAMHDDAAWASNKPTASSKSAGGWASPQAWRMPSKSSSDSEDSQSTRATNNSQDSDSRPSAKSVFSAPGSQQKEPKIHPEEHRTPFAAKRWASEDSRANVSSSARRWASEESRGKSLKGSQTYGQPAPPRLPQQNFFTDKARQSVSSTPASQQNSAPASPIYNTTYGRGQRSEPSSPAKQQARGPQHEMHAPQETRRATLHAQPSPTQAGSQNTRGNFSWQPWGVHEEPQSKQDTATASTPSPATSGSEPSPAKPSKSKAKEQQGFGQADPYKPSSQPAQKSGFFKFGSRSRSSPPSATQTSRTASDPRQNAGNQSSQPRGRSPAQTRVPSVGLGQKQPKSAKQMDSLLKKTEAELAKTRNEPIEVRRRIFKELQRKLHPDKNLECAESAKLAFQKLMESRGSYLAA